MNLFGSCLAMSLGGTVLGFHLQVPLAMHANISTTNKTRFPGYFSTFFEQKSSDTASFKAFDKYMRLNDGDINVSSNRMVSDWHGETFDSSDEPTSFCGAKDISISGRRNRMKVSLAFCGFLAVFFKLMFSCGEGSWRYFLAGGICAAVSHSITTPVDVIKTRKQVDESMKHMTIMASGLKIMKEDGGGSGLLAGLGPTTVGYLFEGSVKFGIYEVLKPLLSSTLSRSAIACSIPSNCLEIIGFVISGGIAGLAASIILCPMEALRIKIVADSSCAKFGWIECGQNVVSHEGLKGLWKSFPAMLCKQVPYTITKNVSFDLITRLTYTTLVRCGVIISMEAKFFIPLISAIVASIFSCISSQPGDMLLSVFNANEGNMTTQDFYKKITKNNGVYGLFVGTKERLLHVGLIVTIQLIIYDFVKRLFGIQSTGL